MTKDLLNEYKNGKFNYKQNAINNSYILQGFKHNYKKGDNFEYNNEIYTIYEIYDTYLEKWDLSLKLESESEEIEVYIKNGEIVKVEEL